MMGPRMQYGGWLALSVPELTDAASAKKATDALTNVKGVAKAVPYIKQRAVGVQLTADGKLMTKDLIEALTKAGLKASNL